MVQIAALEGVLPQEFHILAVGLALVSAFWFTAIIFNSYGLLVHFFNHGFNYFNHF